MSTTKWIQNVGPTGFSSPALAPDGTIYLSTANGVLWGWNPDGSLKHKTNFPASDMLSSVAIAETGIIHFTYLRTLSDGSYYSMLCRVEPAAVLRLLECVAFPDGGITTAPPKLWEYEGTTYAFVPSYLGGKRDLLVFANGRLVTQFHASCPSVVEGGDDDVWKIIVGILTAGISLAIPQANPFQFTVPGIDDRRWHLDPALGIHDRSSEGRAIVVAATSGCPVQGYEWSVGTRAFNLLWQETADPADYYSSPAIFVNGTTTIGRSDGNVRTFHAMTGQLDWEFDAGESVLATPAIISGGDVYIVSERHVTLISGGQEQHTVDLPTATQASPAASLDHVYAAYSNGMVSLDPTLRRSRVADDRIVGGLSSPAIGRDGSVYAVSNDGYLYAFSK